MMGWGNGFGGYGFSPWFGWIGMIIQLAIVIGVIYFLYRLFSKGFAGSEDDSAGTVLRERYARGEISEEEYKRMRDILKK